MLYCNILGVVTMPESLSDVFALAAIVTMGDFFVFGMLGLEAQIGHGSMWNPQPV